MTILRSCGKLPLMTYPLPSLPIDPLLPKLQEALSRHSAVVLQAPPGAGKTTRVPLALLDADWLHGQSILMLEPRRLAATNAARYMARQRGEQVGETVGYRIRYAQEVSSATRIEVVTEGILTRRLQTDPELHGVVLVIFDEFHERNLNSDLALALCRDVQLNLRADLKILVMSATLDATPVATLLAAPLLTSSGRSFPVTVHYLDRDPERDPALWTAAAVQRALRETNGDLLVFLPGAGEIRRCADRLSNLSDIDIRPLYGNLPFCEQEAAIRPGPRRRVVLATNIAETSLTIDGIEVVIDSGLERRPRFAPQRGLNLLETVRISKASATQRTGRAGRLGPGRCYRLWSAGTHAALLPFAPAEISVADLTPLALQLAAWGGTEVSQLAWLDPPSPGRLNAARNLLRLFGALDVNDALTPRGKRLAALPTDPRSARLLLAAEDEDQLPLGIELVTLLNARRELAASADVTTALASIDSQPSTTLDRERRYWQQHFRLGNNERPLRDPAVIARLLAGAWPDRIGRRRPAADNRYLLANGRGATLRSGSAPPGSEWLVAIDCVGRPGAEDEIRLAVPLERKVIEELYPAALAWRREVIWDERAERVVAREVRRLWALVFQERPIKALAEERSAAALDGLRTLGLGVLNWNAPAQRLRARLAFLQRSAAQEGWPPIDDAALLDTASSWLAPLLDTVGTRVDFAKVDLVAALNRRLNWQQRAELKRLAPERITVPSGAVIRLDYPPDGAPVLAVKLQEMFGAIDTPCIVAGRQPVVLHLLSPAGRPLQVTQDLRTFWKDVYPAIKKEMKGRYPKHPWPDDPWLAVPTRRTKQHRN
ncbi:MAG: ATP-dependent helicase HrpB [Desulfuromonadales bacterium]|nr:ATP-dependent helicase HrpB [Desulfuromonadales bacterium]